MIDLIENKQVLTSSQIIKIGHNRVYREDITEYTDETGQNMPIEHDIEYRLQITDRTGHVIHIKHNIVYIYIEHDNVNI